MVKNVDQCFPKPKMMSSNVKGNTNILSLVSQRSKDTRKYSHLKSWSRKSLTSISLKTLMEEEEEEEGMESSVYTHTHLQSDVGPVDAVVGDVEVERRRLLDAGERDGHVVVVGLQGDAADVGVAGEEQEGLGDDARPHVGDELQADGTAALHALRLVEAEVAAAAVVLRTLVGT